ncbi:MAG: hypothetical protein M1818_003683 [Claussenomyces sp. TS43310]|nr:MAG: hypothetical protein M1818_003683 [Claussenomyces sp. TS43310]
MQGSVRDTHALPPEHICAAYWKYSKIKSKDLESDADVVDLRRGLSAEQRTKLHPVAELSAEAITAACASLRGYDHGQGDEFEREGARAVNAEPCTVYEHDDFPGLQIYPSVLPPETQLRLVSLLMHRDLATKHHRTNVQADYHVPYPVHPSCPSANTDVQSGFLEQRELHMRCSSFFANPRSSSAEMLTPKDPSAHKPLNMEQYLHKRLRWLTLGDQYDWPTRSYSGNDATRFPTDIASLVRGLFPELKAESGVVLLYSPKDYMPVHRDVSEQCERGIASISLGCDGIFVVAQDTREGEVAKETAACGKTLVIRVRSGDVVHISGETRWAWHAMPKIIAGTCPEYIQNWPAGSEALMGLGRDSRAFHRWKGYMANKRLNISCRQVWD